jgi:hypothetical protein
MKLICTWFMIVMALLPGRAGLAVEYPDALMDDLAQTLRESGGAVDPVAIDPAWIRFSSSTDILPFHELLITEPLHAGESMLLFAEYLSQNPGAETSYVSNASILMNKRVQAISRYTWDSRVPDIEKIADLLARIHRERGRSDLPVERSVYADVFARTPDALKCVVKNFLAAYLESWRWIQQGRASFEEVASLGWARAFVRSPGLISREIGLFERWMRNGDLRPFLLGSFPMMVFSRDVEERAVEFDFSGIDEPLVFTTALGNIILAGGRDDVHAYDTAPILLLDGGGDDVYSELFSIADLDCPISLTLDMGGSDTYRSLDEDSGAVGANFGVAALYDFGEGDDSFEGKSHCFGYAFAGVSILWNGSGDSLYSVDLYGLGCAEMGVAMLIDGGGDDHYTSLHLSQGCGMLNGFGLLIDHAGNDVYLASATPVVRASSQLKDQNYSGCQGFGTGRFGALLDGYSLPGGIGMLIDVEGDDVYRSSVFGQGAGYGFGIGALVDFAGDDCYAASWYAMGAAAHQACGFLLDVTGNDQYTVSHYMACGAGIDFSLGVMMDLAGKDVYTVENACLGYGLDNSVALFVDAAGDDRYQVDNGLGLGVAKNDRTKTLRGLWPTYGLFIDGAGADVYSHPRWDNGRHWMERDEEFPIWSMGIDREEKE